MGDPGANRLQTFSTISSCSFMDNYKKSIL